MKRRVKKIEVFLVIFISFFVLGCAAYFYYCNRVGSNFPSGDLSFDNPDQDRLLIDHVNELKISGTEGLSGAFRLRSALFERLSLIAFKTSSLAQENVTLLC
jgi:hypothetical protein